MRDARAGLPGQALGCFEHAVHIRKLLIHIWIFCEILVGTLLGLEPRQFKNDYIQSKIIPSLKLAHFFTPIR